VWLALLCAPFYVAWKLALKLTRPTREWVRTERIPLTPPPGGGTGEMKP
jgi:hypothetical protein